MIEKAKKEYVPNEYQRRLCEAVFSGKKMVFYRGRRIPNNFKRFATPNPKKGFKCLSGSKNAILS
jgi:hypothetical protein